MATRNLGSSVIDIEDRCTLYIDTHIAEDKQLMEAFLRSNLPGVVVPTTSSAGGPELVCGQQVYRGNDAIKEYLEQHDRK